MRRTCPFLVLAFVLAALPALGQVARQPPSPGLAAEADRLAAAEFGSGGPGGAVIVVKDGKTLLRKGYGLADAELGVPVRPEMVFRLGSVTKQFTAALVMMLVEEGKIDLGADVTRYLPGYPTQGKRITVEQLLTHNSGIKDYTRIQRLMADANADKSVDQVIDVFKSEPLDFEPGQRMQYSNSGYFLLGAILEKVTGKPYAALVQERIFTPAGMTHSSYIDDTRLLPDRARGYQEMKGTVVNARYYSPTLPYAAGGLMSSVDDLALWDAALAGDTLLRKESRERMFSSAKLPNGRETGYGYGWYTYEYAGMRMQDHGGVIFGFVSYVLRIPGQHLYVALLTNRQLGNAEPYRFARKLALAAIGRPFANPAAASLAPAAIDACLGYYETEGKTGLEFAGSAEQVTMRWGRGEPVELRAASATEFFEKDAFLRVSFEKDASGRIGRAVISDWGSTTTATRVEKPAGRQ